LRPTLDSATSFKTAAQQVRASLIDSLYYGSYPYHMIANHLFPETMNSRPANKYLFLNVETTGQKYPVPGGFATEISPSPVSEMGSNPGMFITGIIDKSVGAILLRCLYNPRFYSDTAVGQFMSKVLAKLQ